MRPQISIVIPCFNAAPFLGEALASAVAQRQSVDAEIIVVDDGSTDGSAAIVRQCSSVRLLQSSNQGVSAARNRGIEVARGKWIKFLDADDLLCEGALARQVHQAEAAGFPVIPFGAYLESTPKRQRRKKPPRLFQHEHTASVILANIHPSTPLHWRALLEKVGGFDHRFRTDEDWDLHVRLAAAGGRFLPDSAPVSIYRIHDAEHRLSNAKPKAADYIEGEMQRLQWTREAIPATTATDAAFARKAIWLARVAIQRDDPQSARRCFRMARAFSPQHYTRFLSARHRLLLRTMGPERGVTALLAYWARPDK